MLEGFRVPPIPATPGRTQPTPSASRSDGAELAGVTISIFGIRFTSFASVGVETLAALGCATDFIGTPNPAKGNKHGRRKKVPGTFPISPATSDTWPALGPLRLRSPGVFEFTLRLQLAPNRERSGASNRV